MDGPPPPDWADELALVAQQADQASSAGDLAGLDAAIGRGRSLLERAHGPEQRFAAAVNLSADLAVRSSLRRSTADLDEAIALIEAAVPTDADDEAGQAANLAARLLARYELDGLPSTLDRVIEIADRPVGPEVTPLTRALLASNLANALATRATHSGAVDDLARVPDIYRVALDALPAGDLRRAGMTTNLANALVDLYQLGRGGHFLDEAAELVLSGIGPMRATDAARVAQTQVNVRLLLFGRTRDQALLDQAVEGARRTAEQIDPQNLSYWQVLSALAAAQHSRYEALGDPHDLDAAIATAESALNTAPERSPSRAGLVNNYSMMLGSRFELLGNSDDLDRSIATLTDTLTTVDVPADEQPALLNNLSASLASRFRHDGDLALYEQAEQRLQQAIDLTPPGAPGLAARLDAMGILAGEAFARSGDEAHLHLAITMGERALAEIAEGSADWPRLANNLAGRLLIRAEVTTSIPDIHRAVELLSRAREASPPTSQVWATASFHLGRALHFAWDQDQEAVVAGLSGRELRQRAVDLWEECCDTSWDDIVIRAGRRLGVIATEIGQWPQARHAFLLALGAADRQTAQRERRDDAERARAEVQGIGAAAAAVSLEMDDPDTAVEILEQASAVLLRSALDREPGPGSAARPDLAPDPGPLTVLYLAATPLGGYAVRFDTGVPASDPPARFVPLPKLEPDQVAAEVSRLRRSFPELQRRQIDLAELERRCQALRTWTWDSVIAPLLDLAQGARRLVLIPVGSVAWLPLLTAAAPRAEPLAWRVPATILPTVGSARPTRLEPDGPVLVVANTGPADAVIPHVRAEANRLVACWPGAVVLGGPQDGADEPGALLPLADLRLLRALDREPDTFPGATPAAGDGAAAGPARAAGLLAEAAGAQLLHLACHCRINPLEPLASTFLCDPPIRVGDLFDAHLRPGSHVVLSACDSGRTGSALPDEAIGPPTALLAAGAASVCASLWPVVDEYTEDFMADYHHRLHGGMQPPEALAAVQRDRVDDPAVLWSPWMVWGV